MREPRSRDYEPADLPGEVWKRARGKGFGHLRVSNLGRVKAVARKKTIHRLGVSITRHYKEQLLRPVCPSKRIEPGSYLQIVNQGHRTTSVHRLVYEAFNGLIPPGHEINHKDGNKQNNCLGNLEALTHSQHMLLSVGEPRKESRVFTIHERMDLYKKWQEGVSLTQLAVDYGTRPITVKRTIEGSTFRKYLNFLKEVYKELPQLRTLLADGFTYRGIAKRYDKPWSKVKRLIKTLGLSSTPYVGAAQEMYLRGYTLEQIAEVHNCSREAIRQQLIKETK